MAHPLPPGPPAQAPTFEPPIAAAGDTPLLQLMIQQQQQQQQQNAQMLALMQSMMAQLSLTPPAPPARVPTPPPPAVAVRQPGAAAWNPWAAPPPPPLSIEDGGCDLCTRHINHICLHSTQDNSLSGGSYRLPTSLRPHSAARVFQLPQEQPNGAVDWWVAAQSRQSENESEFDGGPNQMFPDGAAANGAPLNYAASVTSTMNSCQGQPLHKALKNLQKAIAKMAEGNAEHKGERLIIYETKSMADCAKKLSDKVDLEPYIEAQLLDVIEEAFEQSESLATYANMRLDELSRIDKEEKALIQERPKLSYETF